MKKRKYILEEAGALLIVAALVISMAAATATTNNEQPELTLTTEATQGIFQNIVWDNGMDYIGLGAAQWDEPGQFDAYCADDFLFEEPVEVCDVHWIGGYWNGDPAEFDWGISFYLDDGTGNAPVGIPYAPSFLGPFIFTWAQCNPVEIEPGYYEMYVDLPENYLFPPGTYWISIWGIGAFPPQSGWGIRDTNTIMHEAVFGSDYFGFTFWTDSFDVFGYSADMCFQLTTKEDVIPAICCDPGIMHWTEIEPGATVTGTFVVWNCGDDGSTLNWGVDMTSYPAWMIDFTPTPGSGSIVAPGGSTDVTFTFTAPDEGSTNFEGSIKVVNLDDPSDYCEMSTSLATPVNQNSMFLQILNNFIMQR